MKAVVFDMDGVIIDSEWLVSDCWKIIGEKYNISGVEEVCRMCLGLNKEAARKVFLEHYGEVFPYDVYKQEVSALFHEREKTELELKPGVIELLEWLKKEHFRIGLATSTRESIASEELKRLGVFSFFDQITCGDMLKKSKPEPDIYWMACEKLLVRPEESYAVEDSYNGIRAAYRAGMRAIMVPDLMEPSAEMQEKSVIVCSNLSEVKNYLLSQGNVINCEINGKEG